MLAGVHSTGRLLENYGVLITGGSRGIGAGIVRAMLEHGAEVAFIYQRGTTAAQDLAHEMSVRHPDQRCLAIRCDVTDTIGMQEAMDGARAELGRIDVLVNNAGVTRDATLARMTRDQWDDVISTNLGSMFSATKPLLMHLAKQRSGSIVNVTSLAGIYGSSGQANYAASKAGIIGFTKSLAKEVASVGVRVNAVAPGFINTDMIATVEPDRLSLLKTRIPAGRLGTVAEVAEVVCFLASDRARYVTGQVIEVAGGLTL